MAMRFPPEEQKYIDDLENLLNFSYEELSKVGIVIHNSKLKTLYFYSVTGNVYTNASAILTLIKEAKTTACNNLLRTLVEDFINVHYVYCIRSEDNLLKYLLFDVDDRKKLATRIKKYLEQHLGTNLYKGEPEGESTYWDDFVAKLNTEEKAIKTKSRKADLPNLPPLQQRAIEVDRIRNTNLEWWYINLYWLFSIHSHATLRGLNTQFIRTNQATYFELEGDVKDIIKIAATTYMILFFFVNTAFEKFHLDKLKLKEHKKVFTSYSLKKSGTNTESRL